jgi:hypothetical protein
MRNFVLAALFVLLAAALASCSDPPAASARRALGKATSTLQVAENGAKQAVRTALDAVAAQERARTLAELAAAGCSATTSQPTNASEACRALADAGRSRYLLASRRVASVAAKVDASVGLAYAAILVAVQTVGEFDVGIGTPKGLADVVARVLKHLETVLVAYREAKAFYDAVTTGGVP